MTAAKKTDNIIDSIQSPQTTGRPIPSEVMHANVVWGYISGNNWLTYEPYKQARPDLAEQGLVIPVTLTSSVPHGTKRAMYDMEDGGGHPENIGAFASRVDRSEPFYLYTFASAGANMLAWARRFGFEQGRDFYYVSAHANKVPHICAPDVCGYPKADVGQFLFAGSYDQSLAWEYAFRPLKPPKLVSKYDLFPDDVGDPRLPNKGNERLTVEQADGALEHPVKFHDYLKGEVRANVKTFRDRCMRVATHLPPDFVKRNPHPAWVDNRKLGARWFELNNRIKRIDAIR